MRTARRPFEVEAGELLDLLQPVHQRVPVDEQLPRRLRHVQVRKVGGNVKSAWQGVRKSANIERLHRHKVN